MGKVKPATAGKPVGVPLWPGVPESGPHTGTPYYTVTLPESLRARIASWPAESASAYHGLFRDLQTHLDGACLELPPVLLRQLATAAPKGGGFQWAIRWIVALWAAAYVDVIAPVGLSGSGTGSGANQKGAAA